MSSSYNVFYYTVFTVNPEEPESMKFNVTIDRDEDGVWIVGYPRIPGCVS